MSKPLTTVHKHLLALAPTYLWDFISNVAVEYNLLNMKVIFIFSCFKMIFLDYDNSFFFFLTA